MHSLFFLLSKTNPPEKTTPQPMEYDAFAWHMELYTCILYSYIALYIQLELNLCRSEVGKYCRVTGIKLMGERNVSQILLRLRGDVLQKMRSEVGYFRKIGV